MAAKFLGLVLAAAALAGCMRGPSDADSAEELMQVSRDWSADAQGGDMAKVLEYYADEAMIIDAGRDPIRGKAAIRAYLEQALAIPGFAIRWEPVSAKVDGSLGYMIERTQITMNGPDGRPVRQMYNGLSVWQKLPDGKWRNVVGTSIPGPKAGPPAAE